MDAGQYPDLAPATQEDVVEPEGGAAVGNLVVSDERERCSNKDINDDDIINNNNNNDNNNKIFFVFNFFTDNPGNLPTFLLRISITSEGGLLCSNVDRI